ncbi:(2,3-dihydroxybenzoyl)adenylate synthase [Acinetobacter sp. ANC 3813]|uniref:(2,3-dihydroxybenzoyl)adenylate synthase n=1 Tax=Acinetobacter sp. ANC 3813 TaxID=1977873 RepID=UPI000A3493DE|nr:AMP-binding protein [Acinetobacter sp. ANC 3813]OTG92142.1 2,3-dihydroxybenzoate-AMP ligase [Acinetobacter sp. ANC 3813]
MNLEPLLEQKLSEGIVPYPLEFAEKYIAKGYWIGQTISEFFAECADKYAENTALICGEREYSYCELQQRIDEFAVYLTQQGYQTGDAVVIQLPNIAEFFIAYFASLRIGMRPVMSLPAHRHAELSYFINQTQAKLYICADKFMGFDYRTLAQICQQRCESLKQVIVVGDAGEFDSWPDTAQLQKKRVVPPKLTARHMAFFQLSGGSTGTPKLIPRTHDDYLYSVRASAEICELNQQTKMLMVLPVAHNFSMSSAGSLGLFYAGGTLVLSQDPSADACFKFIQQHQITHISLVPALAASWAEAVQKGAENIFAKLEVLQVGGARLADALARQLIEQYHCRLQQVFGMAEGLVNYTRYDDDVEQIITTQGSKISPDDEIKVVDDQDQEVPQGEVGHLLTRGPYTIRGYYNAPEHNRSAFTVDGFYRTGDLVRINAAGNIIVEGRSKDQINRGGEKIATEEVEQVLNQHPQVIQSALVSMPDAMLGEKSCAYIQWRADAQDPSATRLMMQLRQYVQSYGLATYKIPDRIEFVEDMPYTALGKIDKKALRQRLAA